MPETRTRSKPTSRTSRDSKDRDKGGSRDRKPQPKPSTSSSSRSDKEKSSSSSRNDKDSRSSTRKDRDKEKDRRDKDKERSKPSGGGSTRDRDKRRDKDKEREKKEKDIKDREKDRERKEEKQKVSSRTTRDSRDKRDSRKKEEGRIKDRRDKDKDKHKDKDSKRSSSRRRETDQERRERKKKEAEAEAERAAKAREAEEASTRRKQWDKDNINSEFATDQPEIVPDPEPEPEPEAEQIDEVVEDAVGEEGDDDYNYDDDEFEDYDDDFEDDVEDDDEEEKFDSGHYESTKSKMEQARNAKEIEAVKLAMHRENSARNPRSRPGEHHHPDMESDDSGKGSDRSKTEEPKEQPGFPAGNRIPTSRGYINFSSAKQRHKHKIAAAKSSKRGDMLLGMIRLDIASFEIFDLPPIRYEAFMKTFGKGNAMQAICQTGDDNLEEEIQTEPINSREKWTQAPPATISLKMVEEDPDLLAQHIRGVGGDLRTEESSQDPESYQFIDRSNSQRLTRFLGSAGSALLTLLEEESEFRHREDLQGQDQKDVEFTEKITILNTELPYLSSRPITTIAFAPDQPSVLLTAHGYQILDENNGYSTLTDFSFKTYLCVWNVSHPSAPSKVLVANNFIRCCTFSPTKASLAFAGLLDGTVCAWDLRESLTHHQEVTREVIDEQEVVFRSPSYTSGGASGDGSSGHSTVVTSIRPLPESKDISGSSVDSGYSGEGMPSFQLVTIDERGILVIWTVLDSQHDFEQHLGLAHWGTVRLVQTQRIELSSLLGHDLRSMNSSTVECSANDVCFDPDDGSRLHVATEAGNILHVSTAPHHRPNPRSYKPEYDALSACRSLAFCPFGEGYMLAGSDDGSVRLHAVTNERPLISWPGTVDGQPIVQVLWSASRPCVFFVLDNISRIHLWDLNESDIYPEHTVQFEDEISWLALNPELGDPRQKQLLALGMANGKVEVHHLKSTYKTVDDEATANELERFLHYVAII